MATIKDLLVEDTADKGIGSYVFVLATGDTFLQKNEGYGDKGDANVGEKHEGGEEGRDKIFMRKKVDLMMHFEEYTDTILDKGGDE